MKARTKLLTALCALILLAPVLAGCGGGSGSGDSDSDGGGDAEAAESGAYIIAANDTDIVGFDPHKSNDIVSAVALKAVYDTLVYSSESFELGPGLAESWEWLDDNSLQFKLREGVQFHNGELMTSEDVKFTLDRLKESGFVGHLVAMVEEVEIVDGLTLNLKTTDASAALIANLSHPGSGILCKSHIEGLEAEGKSIDDDPVGTGPYIYENWTIGTEYTLRANENYYSAERAPQNAGVTVRYMPEYNAQVIAMQNAEIDLSIMMSPNNLPEVEADPSLKVLRFEATEGTFAAFNCSKAPFDNLKLRQALNHTVNRDNIIQVYLNGEGVPNYSGLAVGAVGYTDDVTKYEYDLDKAKQLLAEAGYPDGLAFNMIVCTEFYAAAATVWQAELKKIGVDASIEILELGAYYDMTGRGDHEVALSGWYVEADPDGTYEPWFNSAYIGQGGNNFACFNSPEIDELLFKGQTTKDLDERLEYYYEIARIAADNAVYAPMSSATGFVVYRENIGNITPDPGYMLRFNGIVKS
jgi:peptide/nickel transport system substrate-binding protein